MRIDFPGQEKYRVFYIPKRNGGQRKIEAPCQELLQRQREVLKKLYPWLPASPYAHGFVKTKNIVTAVSPHVGAPYIIKLDIEEFFPSITWEVFCREYKWLYENYLKRKSEVPPLEQLLKLAAIGFIKENSGTIRLPQGGALSPALSNVVMFRVDGALGEEGIRRGVKYTRYADDIILSSEGSRELFVLKRGAKLLLAQLGLRLNPKKERRFFHKRKVIILGLSIGPDSSRPRLPRPLRRKLRLLWHLRKKFGVRFDPKTEGLLGFYAMTIK